MQPVDEEVEYDTSGRMKYHPSFHENQGQPWTASDLEYLCKFHEFDELETLALALGRTKSTCAHKVSEFKRNGLFEY
ncbi:DNA-entry nuclease [Peribacillus alkalitolerans]|uniref:DNA-entry nuclease n=1 Tax=Peribacillus alkalitolerans TaxID=1550385 RepID=UPI0013D7F9F3|nr:DNA-entry nuclease [Peribacillus alkalitolerans]